MADQFYFKFFSAQYLLDSRVDLLALAAQAILVRIWCIINLNGYCPADPATLARKILCDIEEVKKYLPALLPFFEEREGKLYSPRMEEEKRRSEIYRKNALNKTSNSNSKKQLKQELELENSSANCSAISAANSSTRSRACQLPDDFQPNEHHRQLAGSLGLAINSSFESFKDHHLARGTTFKDWDRALSQWLRREPSFAHRNNGSTLLSIADQNKVKAAEFQRRRNAGAQ